MRERRNLTGVRVVALAVAFVLFLLGGAYAGIKFRWFRAPYPSYGKAIAWALGNPEEAYNFDVVVPGRLYRSGRPDERFIKYLRESYGIQRIISLTSKAHETARELGIKVAIFQWGTNELPPRQELKKVLDIITREKPVLLHCAGGSDRTGYTMAIFRVLHQGWNLDRAQEEMARYWHKPQRNAGLHQELEDLLRSPSRLSVQPK
jgi:hypothetical protein